MIEIVKKKNNWGAQNNPHHLKWFTFLWPWVAPGSTYHSCNPYRQLHQMYPTPYHSHLKKLTFSCLPGGKCIVFVLLKGERGGQYVYICVFWNFTVFERTIKWHKGKLCKGHAQECGNLGMVVGVHFSWVISIYWGVNAKINWLKTAAKTNLLPNIYSRVHPTGSLVFGRSMTNTLLICCPPSGDNSQHHERRSIAEMEIVQSQQSPLI